MKLVEELREFKPNYIIISGDGRNEFKILKELCREFNGQNKILWFPFTILSRKTGLKALDSVKTIPSLYALNSIIYIVDGDVFEGAADIQIKKYLQSIGIEVVDINPIQEALLIQCRFGNHDIILYCIISGPETFIEEEIAKLIELKLGVKIDLSGNRDRSWKENVRYKIKQVRKENQINLEQLMRSAGRNNLERAFPNICAVFRKIEEDFN